jgi:hypothetical protein
MLNPAPSRDCRWQPTQDCFHVAPGTFFIIPAFIVFPLSGNTPHTEYAALLHRCDFGFNRPSGAKTGSTNS